MHFYIRLVKVFEVTFVLFVAAVFKGVYYLKIQILYLFVMFPANSLYNHLKTYFLNNLIPIGISPLIAPIQLSSIVIPFQNLSIFIILFQLILTFYFAIHYYRIRMFKALVLHP